MLALLAVSAASSAATAIGFSYWSPDKFITSIGWKKYSSLDQEKIRTLATVYRKYVLPFLSDAEIKEAPELEKIPVHLSLASYNIGAALQNLQIGLQVSKLCEQQKQFIEQRYFGSSLIVTPENLILEDFKCWLIKLSHLSADKFVEKLSDEIERRLAYLDSLIIDMQLDWREGFFETVRDLKDIISRILKIAKEKIKSEKCRNLLLQIVNHGRTFSTNVTKFFCIAIDDDALQRKIALDQTMTGLLSYHDDLMSNFYGQLVIFILNNDGLSTIFDITKPQDLPPTFPFRDGNTDQEKAFENLAKKVCNFVYFINVCQKFVSINRLGGDLLTSHFLQDSDRIRNLCEAYEALASQINENLERIVKIYKKQGSALVKEIKDLESKESCPQCCICSRTLIKKRKQLDVLKKRIFHIHAIKVKLSNNMQDCRQNLHEAREFTIESPAIGMQRLLHDSLGGLVATVSKFITNIRQIEYCDSITLGNFHCRMLPDSVPLPSSHTQRRSSAHSQLPLDSMFFSNAFGKEVERASDAQRDSGIMEHSAPSQPPQNLFKSD